MIFIGDDALTVYCYTLGSERGKRLEEEALQQSRPRVLQVSEPQTAVCRSIVALLKIMKIVFPKKRILLIGLITFLQPRNIRNEV